jgi:hypothetical protein
LTGLDLKKIKNTVFAVLLVFTMVQAKSTLARIVFRTPQAHTNAVCRFVSSIPSKTTDIAESSGDICPQTISQRNEFKKIFHFNYTTSFQTQTLHFTNPELILSSRSFPAIPLYISHCTILI